MFKKNHFEFSPYLPNVKLTLALWEIFVRSEPPLNLNIFQKYFRHFLFMSIRTDLGGETEEISLFDFLEPPYYLCKLIH